MSFRVNRRAKKVSIPRPFLFFLFLLLLNWNSLDRDERESLKFRKIVRKIRVRSRLSDSTVKRNAPDPLRVRPSCLRFASAHPPLLRIVICIVSITWILSSCEAKLKNEDSLRVLHADVSAVIAAPISCPPHLSNAYSQFRTYVKSLINHCLKILLSLL